MKNYQLVLASTSPFRQQLLKKLAIPFITATPNCSETVLAGETAEQLVQRLAILKAHSCDINEPALIIGSDQVCEVNGHIVGKPHTREKAIEQLSAQSGQVIRFYTGVAIFNTHTQQHSVAVDTFDVHFRSLTREQIEYYVDTEQPWYCAGSFKCEGLGIALFERLEGKDPNALIGLPMITLIDLLAAQGLTVLANP